jgi:hypothetical protein
MPVPIIDDRGFDQFGIGPFVRHVQLAAGTYPTPRRPKPWHPTVPLSIYGRPDTPKPIEVRVDLQDVVTREEYRRTVDRLDGEMQEIADAVAAVESNRGTTW